ncbi:MAG: hypothetical protein KDI64_17865, partial [Candidatus Accumulibacter sp.]|nr:hypothetical protein [Accumulibacter sp.]
MLPVANTPSPLPAAAPAALGAGPEVGPRFRVRADWNTATIQHTESDATVEFVGVTDPVQIEVFGDTVLPNGTTAVKTVVSSLDGLNTLTTYGDFTFIGLDPAQVTLVKPSAALSSRTSSGDASDEKKLADGLSAFATWIATAGDSIVTSFEEVGTLPYTDFSFTSLLGAENIADLAQTISKQVAAEVAGPVSAIFASGDATAQTLADAVSSVRLGHSSGAQDFTASVDLADFRHGFTLNLGDNIFGDFGLAVTQSTPVNLDLALDLDFDFGLDASGDFYVADPTVFLRLELGSGAPPLDISVALGPLAMGIEDGEVSFELGLGVGTDGRLSIDTLNGDVSGSLLGTPKLGSDASFNLYLPVELQGALAGLQGEPVVLSGSYHSHGADISLGAFLTSLAGTVLSANFDDFIDFKNVSLDVLLDALIAGLNGLVGQSSEVQSVATDAVSGRFQLTFDGQTSTALDAATASAHDIETALDGLTTLVGFPDGISVSVTGTGSLDDPWLIQFITPDSIDITQQIGALALGALVNGDGNAATLTTATVSNGGVVDPDSLAYKRLPLVNKSLVQVLGNGSDDVIAQITDALRTVRSDLRDIQSFEVDVNFALDDALGIAPGLGDKQALKQAVEVLRAVSAGLDGLSTDADLALAIAWEPGQSDAFAQLRDDRGIAAAANTLAAISGTLDAASSDDDLALALAAASALSDYQTLLANRDALVADSAFVDAVNVLNGFGLGRFVS